VSVDAVGGTDVAVAGGDVAVAGGEVAVAGGDVPVAGVGTTAPVDPGEPPADVPEVLPDDD